MARILECVPNFSEGKSVEIINQILDEIKSVDGVKILDSSMDADHNRSVVSFAGEPEKVIEAAYLSIKKAKELIDLRTHKGEHPRMGATDVCPLIPISEIDVAEAKSLAIELAKKVGELDIPVFLYEDSASAPHRVNLADIRKGEYEGMEEKIKEDLWKPDFGPANRNLTAGTIAIGTRAPLVAYNVYLGTNDISIAKAIAKSVRAKAGGYTYVKAMGFEIKERALVQVSMNMVNYKKSSLFRTFEAIKREALCYGVNIVESEIIGLVPQEALIDVAKWYLQLHNFENDQVLESRL